MVCSLHPPLTRELGIKQQAPHMHHDFPIEALINTIVLGGVGWGGLSLAADAKYPFADECVKLLCIVKPDSVDMHGGWKGGGNGAQGSADGGGGFVGDWPNKVHAGVGVSDHEQVDVAANRPLPHGTNKVKQEEVTRVEALHSTVGAWLPANATGSLLA